MQNDTRQRKEVNKKKLGQSESLPVTQFPFIFLYQLQMSICNPGHPDKCLTPIKHSIKDSEAAQVTGRKDLYPNQEQALHPSGS